MDEYIRRGEAIEQFEDSTSAIPEKLARIRIEEVPAADVAPVRHGKWIPAQDYSNGNEDIECSSCGEWFKSLELCGRLGEPNYCPVCGSKNKDGGHGDGD